MFDYDEAASLAHELLEEFGEAGTLVRSVGGAPADPAKPWAPGAAVVTNYTVHLAQISESILRRETLVKTGEVVMLLAASELTVTPDPSLDHIVRADGSRYAIVRVDPFNPAGTVVFYEIIARS